MLTTTRKRLEDTLNSDAASVYADYWTRGTAVDERTRRLNDWIIGTFLTDIYNQRVLEVGVGGEGGLIYQLKSVNSVTGVDVSSSAVENCRDLGLDVSRCDVNRDDLPYADNTFGCAIALEVFEHFSNPQRALEEISRALSPGGKLLISIPSRWSYHWPRCFYPELIYGDNAFRNFLMINGFAVVQEENGIVPCNQSRSVPERYTYQNIFFMCRKLGAGDSERYFENACYFWEQIDDSGMRIDPLPAIDLFRESYACSGSPWSLLALTHALLYRVINCELDEFREHFQRICVLDGEIPPEQRDRWRINLSKLLLEAALMGLPLVEASELEKVRAFARSRQDLIDFCTRLHIQL